jgi:hypothetical protein
MRTMSEQLKKFGRVRIPGDELTFLDGVKIELFNAIVMLISAWHSR